MICSKTSLQNTIIILGSNVLGSMQVILCQQRNLFVTDLTRKIGHIHGGLGLHMISKSDDR